jgi:NodT family efflux transporter outer membrane factor (OMF) lipoprotein
MRTPLIPSAALALAACTMIPTTNPPPQAVPQAWHDSAGSRTAAPAAETPWWTAFPDTTLRGLIRSALARNTDIRGAAENVTTAEAYLRSARTALLPALSVDASAATGGSKATTTLPAPFQSGESRSTYDRYGASVDAWWDADLFGVRRSGVAASQAQLQATEEERRGVALSIVASVAGAYANLRETDRLRSVYERTLTDRLRVLEIAQRRVVGGSSGDLDVLRARNEAEGIRRALVDVAESAAHGENALSLLTGRAPGAIARPGTPDENPLAVVIPSSLPATLLQRRPDVRAAERQLEGSAAYVGQVRGELLPHLTLSAGAGFSRYVSRNPAGPSDSLGNPTTLRATTDSKSWSVSAAVVQPLFGGGYDVARLRAAESGTRRAAIAYEATVLRALADAEDALASVRFAAQRRVSLDSQVVLTRAALPLAEGRYERGEAPFLEVLYAQGALLGAETGAVSAWYGEVRAFIRLYQALGGGWDADAAREPAPGR